MVIQSASSQPACCSLSVVPSPNAQPHTTWSEPGKKLAAATERQIIIVDPTKLVERLGTQAPLPVEVVPFATAPVTRALAERNSEPTLRMQGGAPFVTDNGNHIIDARFPRGIDDARSTDTWLNTLPGVVENGLFVAMTHLVVVGEDDGSSRLIDKD